MYNLIEYSDNYSDTLGRLWQFKWDELSRGVVNPNITTANYKSGFLK